MQLNGMTMLGDSGVELQFRCQLQPRVRNAGQTGTVDDRLGRDEGLCAADPVPAIRVSPVLDGDLLQGRLDRDAEASVLAIAVGRQLCGRSAQHQPAEPARQHQRQLSIVLRGRKFLVQRQVQAHASASRTYWTRNRRSWAATRTMPGSRFLPRRSSRTERRTSVRAAAPSTNRSGRRFYARRVDEFLIHEAHLETENGGRKPAALSGLEHEDQKRADRRWRLSRLDSGRLPRGRTARRSSSPASKSHWSSRRTSRESASAKPRFRASRTSFR